MRIGLVRSAIGYSPPQTTMDNFLRIGGDTRKNIPFHISTDSFGQKLGTCSEKISLSLCNGHFIRRLAGKAGIKFPSRKVPPNLQRTLFRLNAGMAAKYFWTEFPSYFTTDIFSEKNRGLPEKVKIKCSRLWKKRKHHVLRIWDLREQQAQPPSVHSGEMSVPACLPVCSFVLVGSTQPPMKTPLCCCRKELKSITASSLKKSAFPMRKWWLWWKRSDVII